MNKLLLLEDDLSLIDGLSFALKKQGVSFGYCSDGEGGGGGNGVEWHQGVSAEKLFRWCVKMKSVV
ncbi:MAG: hypothetical protein E6Z15_07000 [Paenibacillus macerans]|nr:hypothetical protein [Paenibacillus macerans]